MIKKSMAGIDGLGSLSSLNGAISNRSSIVDAINAVHTVAQTAAAGFKFYTVADKTTNVTAVVGDQVHVTDDGDGNWSVYRVTAPITNATIAASSGSVEKLMDANTLWHEFTAGQITDIGNLIANISVTGSIDLDALAAAVAVNSAKVSNVTTDLSSTTTATTVTVVSSDGTDAVLAAASGTDAGVMSAADKTKLDGIAAGAQVNTVDSVAGKTGAVTLVKGDVGLANVDNTSDANKPISTAQQSALDLKAPIDSPTFTGTVGGITKSMVGLGNVDNTSDAAKPVSTATQSALDLKAPLNSPTFTGTVGGITKAMVGLANVDNTSDAAKPVSTAQQTALDLKANLDSPTFTGTVGGITKSMVGLANVDNTSDADKPVSTAQQSALDLKAPINNPSFTGTVSGVTKGMVGLGNVENTALSTWAGTANITTVGTITSGTWNGTALGDAYITQSSVTQHQAALTITTSQVSNLSITTNSVSDGTNTFTGKSYTIVTESLAVNEAGEITLTSAAVANTLLNFNTARHTSGGVSADYTVTHSAGNVYTVDASLNGQAVTVQYMKLV